MNDRDDLATRAKEEFSAMAKQGMAHPSTKPVLTGAAIGAVAGAVLPVVSIPLGIVAGAGFMFWKRISR
ncbi:hypothetical protein Saro_2241 [Novosphingobium aromaticivorans DSM 12444]|uniref:Uncharacterized protein n=1 Tax=Novosphingobium aromaticivorans (strain ATCC 700278 / DSM 12444 / CCUG 56034 / CIP 105152 / NBRC 16084 / F199) TaxID=279238 RepID=Q2G645_NOVAD|nr:hypothetical protein [Novosphingobium aromaticivorans]ABD26678.1 hypothetical protein Saro_2241 [Novosphingobium aromaticivorans DSM 12444]SCY39028.1 hypothetical protein SAMN05660666_01491 [Novosphingobium aromaticivorans]